MGATTEKQLKDQELTAVIAAAISAYEEEWGGAEGGFVVRRITRLPDNPWGQAGITDCLNSRKVY
ncbi:hypothetical protein Ami103574_13745 [Aminipila butyrica]|uniref:Uncharacterized protein n=1 Tax=Aminipila butyrica TaxID=433296 RepID=A0A858BYU9_9FIRM|nr:hypothetical protein [Aminipila butyrica]QIB70288.1 hypothetical protein Ami103574_13745 [Aminipila butyrica]